LRFAFIVYLILALLKPEWLNDAFYLAADPPVSDCIIAAG